MGIEGLEPESFEVELTIAPRLLEELTQSMIEEIKLTFPINDVPKDIVRLMHVIMNSIDELIQEIMTLKTELDKS